MKKTYRLQRRTIEDKVQRGWGYGKVQTYGIWHTLATFDHTLDGAKAADKAYDQNAGKGLYQYRIVCGREVVRKQD